MKPCIRALMTSVVMTLPSLPTFADQAQSQDLSDKGYWELLVGPFAVHWSRDEAHKNVFLLGLERGQPDGTLWGVAAFQNSFGQACAYAYYGYRWDDVFGYAGVYAKISGGILYGYKEPYEDKIPVNHNGWGLAIIPAVGYRITPKDAVEVGMLGTAGLMFMYSRRF
ncbi:ABC transporter ATP-binding protein [Variovorax sp. J22R24]|uniref:ABC transporter ATP-binding protein n=1 Tax=Variovorax gracilis TaxID=3053502 RepID=UPI002577C2EE|nr:ABC transporter ATP-binding protein [Variovorax sp. J22R24]MDM0105963.1 ABC transporter ATP-binding protein [Variovorax sp. J22R24]